MNQRVVITLLEGIEELTPLLDKLPEASYTLLFANAGDFSTILEKNITHIQADVDSSFIIVFSKGSYFMEEEKRGVAKILTESGIKAEPVFLVVDRDFAWKDIDQIIQHNHLFFHLPTEAEGLLKDFT